MNFKKNNFIYGIYSNNLERFFLVSDDCWMTMHSAKLLSSKFSLTVCAIDKNIPINNSNCIWWTLTDASITKADKQSPRLSIAGNKLEQLENFIVDTTKEKLEEYQEISQFVIQVVEAAWLTHALVTFSDHKQYMTLIDADPMFISMHDDSGIDGGFLNGVDKILYTCTDKKSAELALDHLVNDTVNNKMPTYLSYYKNIFKSQLNE